MSINQFLPLHEDSHSLSNDSDVEPQIGSDERPPSRNSPDEPAQTQRHAILKQISWSSTSSESPIPLRHVPPTIERSYQKVSKRLAFVDEPREAVLCETCSAIFQQTPKGITERDPLWHTHHRSQQALDRAFQHGCKVCITVGQQMRSKDIHLGHKVCDRRGDVVCELRYRCEPIASNVDFAIASFEISEYGSESQTTLIDWLLLRQRQKPGELVVSPVPRRSIPTATTLPAKSTNSSHVWDLCRYWLYLCRTKHVQCGTRSNTIGFMPTRLVHVQRVHGQIAARLRCFGPSDTPVDYLSLSHCWGDSKFFTLRMDLLQQAQKEFKLPELPRVFQDAFHSTLELGYSHIWIDSLCIIQDSKADWLAESARMGDIYRYSACNIAATGFPDGSKGFFTTRAIDEDSCPTVTTQWRAKSTRYADVQAGTYYLCDTEHFRNHVSQAPLNLRAWVLQERVLSPCVLHFGNKQVYWECFESTCSEAFPHGFPLRTIKTSDLKSFLLHGDDLNENRYSKASRLEHVLPTDAAKTGHELRVYTSWYRIVEHYSIGRLSRSEDKLLAISGVAKAIKEISHSRYLAGLWEEDFVRGLTWQVNTYGKLELPLGEYRAPTWSWASIDAQIHYYEARFGGEHPTFNARLIWWEVHHRTSDTTGLVTGARAQMRGFLRPVAGLDVGSLVQPGATVNGTKISIMTRFDLCQERFSWTDASAQPALSLVKGANGAFDVQMSNAYQKVVLSKHQMYLFPLMTYKGEYQSSPDEITVGLLLVRSGNDQGRYIRIGLFQVDDSTSRNAIMNPNAGSLPSDLWEGRLDNGECVISMF